MRLLKTALATVAALAAISGTSVVVFAYPTPTAHHDIDCHPGTVDAQGGSCSVVFSDRDKHDNPVYGQQVCFSVDGPGTIQPTCSTTDTHGDARATYYVGAVPSQCSSDPKGDKVTTTIYGQETGSTADEMGADSTKVQIKCPKSNPPHPPPHHGPPPPHHDNTPANSGAASDSSSSTDNAQNASASLVLSHPASPAGTATGIGILALIVALSVVISGRLRMRHLRR